MSGARGWRPTHNPWLIAVVVTLGAFMEVLDTTIVNVALPHIAGSLSVSNDDATWTLTSYLVANGVVLTISGWLGSLFGRKRYFLICIGMFTVCSFLCGIAQSLPQLILFRLMQGFFGGGLQPNQQSIILDTFPPAQRGKAFGITAIATIVAPVLGPTLGGWITDTYTWRWVFLINVPVGLLTFFAVAQLVEDPPWAGKRIVRVDFIGVALITLGLGTLQVMMDRGEDDDWFGSSFIITMAALAAIGIFGAIAWLLYTDKPVVDLRVFKDRNFALGATAIAVMAAVLYASAVVIPQFAQQVLGYTATWSGFILSPGGLVIIALIPIIGRLMPIVPLKYLIATGFAVMGCSLIYSHYLAPDINFGTLAKMRAAQTTGLAFLFVPITTIAYSTLPKEQNGDASALFTMFRNVAGSIGISLATALVTERMQIRQAHLVAHLSPTDRGYSFDFPMIERGLRLLGRTPTAADQGAMGYIYQQLHTQASVLAYSDVFMVTAILSFTAIPLALCMSGKVGKGGGGPAH